MASENSRSKTEWRPLGIVNCKLEEADELCHDNWIEIQHLREYIDRLQALLTEHGIAIPDEY